MSDLFSLTAETGSGMNTSKVESDGNNIVEYGTNLQQLLADFDSVVKKLTSKGMTGYMSEQALAGYGKVKDSLDEYAKALVNTGNAVLESVEDTKSTSTKTGDALQVV